VRKSKVGAATALAQIVALVQEAQNSTAPGQRLGDKAAFWLVLVALIGGTATFLAWLLAGAEVPPAILFAITVAVIICPDALGLATPTANVVGSGLGAKRGILFRNATGIETAARIDTVVLDKTGTLTKASPKSPTSSRSTWTPRSSCRWPPQRSASPGIRSPNLGWAIGYNAIALPIAAGVFYPAFGIMLSPEIPAISMSGSSVIVAASALLLKGLRLPEQAPTAPEAHLAAAPIPSPR
jgi:cation transport ATPase